MASTGGWNDKVTYARRLPEVQPKMNSAVHFAPGRVSLCTLPQFLVLSQILKLREAINLYAQGIGYASFALRQNAEENSLL